ncbi:hypothetical protein TOC8171_17830 [Pseudomonas syringae]
MPADFDDYSAPVAAYSAMRISSPRYPGASRHFVQGAFNGLHFYGGRARGIFGCTGVPGPGYYLRMTTTLAW